MRGMEALAGRLGDIPMIASAKAVKAKSRDFFWFSPILKEKLDHVIGDLVVMPRSEAEVVAVLAACHDLDIPVTPRGGGTGNYGQAMPLAGGVVLDMTRMAAIRELRDGVVVAEAGAILGDIDRAAREALGQELRMHPSTLETASIGGFVAGGSGGVGSVRWGALAETGNILRLRIATMEARPRIVELTGGDIEIAHHAYGTTGVITEVELPLAPAPDWTDMLIGFRSWSEALQAGWEISGSDGLWLKQLAAFEAPVPETYFRQHSAFLREGDHVICAMVAPNSADALADAAIRLHGRIALRSDQASSEELAGLPHLHHLTWNHTTLRAQRVDPCITYLQIGFPGGRELPVCEEISRRFAGEVLGHVEFMRGGGVRRLSGLPLVRFHSPERLRVLMAELEELGCPVWNPHVYTLEEGNRRDADPRQLEMKQMHDPKGLLNPGKMIAWERPSYRYDPESNYVYSGLSREREA